MRRLFIDANVAIYAVGGPSEHKEACLRIFRRAALGELELHASVEMVQEFLFHRLRRCERGEAVSQARVLGAGLVLHEFTTDVLERALDLVERHGMRGRDAVHAATSLGCDVTDFVTVDSDFDQCPGLDRLDPRNA